MAKKNRWQPIKELVYNSNLRDFEIVDYILDDILKMLNTEIKEHTENGRIGRAEAYKHIKNNIILKYHVGN